MAFHAAIHSFGMQSNTIHQSAYFSSLANRQKIVAELKKEIRLLKNVEYIGAEQNAKPVQYVDIQRSDFLNELQEYCANADKCSLDDVYTGIQQTRFNHLVEIKNSIGIYLPTFFFFPTRIEIEDCPVPIYVGSGVKLFTELQEIDAILKAGAKVNIGKISPKFQLDEEGLEDIEATHEGVEDFWPSTAYLVMSHLIQVSLKSKMPLFVY